MVKFDAELVGKMRKLALDNPHHPMTGALAPEACLHENIEYGGESLTIMLTLNIYPDLGNAWSLSVSRSDLTEAKKESVIAIVLATLGAGKPYFEITDELPPPMRFQRQFYMQTAEQPNG